VPGGRWTTQRPFCRQSLSRASECSAGIKRSIRGHSLPCNSVSPIVPRLPRCHAGDNRVMYQYPSKLSIHDPEARPVDLLYWCNAFSTRSSRRLYLLAYGNYGTAAATPTRCAALAPQLTSNHACNISRVPSRYVLSPDRKHKPWGILTSSQQTSSSTSSASTSPKTTSWSSSSRSYCLRQISTTSRTSLVAVWSGCAGGTKSISRAGTVIGSLSLRSLRRGRSMRRINGSFGWRCMRSLRCGSC